MTVSAVAPPTTWRQGWPALVLSTLSRVLLGALGLLLAASVLPAAVGWQSSVVMSGSMAPTLSPGDVAVVRPVDTADLRPGQVLLVDDPDVPGRLRVHRLLAVQAGGLQLKGDANPAADGSLVAPAAVHGVVTLGLPLVGEPAVWAAERRVWPLVGPRRGWRPCWCWRCCTAAMTTRPPARRLPVEPGADALVGCAGAPCSPAPS